MFDVSFTELMTLAVVALVVIGPERLPKVARTVGHLLGRAQRYVNDIKSDIRREVELDELRSLKQEMEGAARKLEDTVRSNVDDLNQSMTEVQQSVEQQGKEINQALQATDAAASAVDAGTENATNISDASPASPEPVVDAASSSEPPTRAADK